MEMIAAVFGFFAPFVTEAFKYFQKKQDNAHELQMLGLQIEARGKEHLYRIEEINVQGDIQEAIAIRTPEKSFGVQLLDAAKGQNLNGWALYPAFWLFTILDFLSGLVRPSITYAAFAFYVSVKWAQLDVALRSTGTTADALLQVWGASDMSVVILVLSYWFGQRAAKAAFGGSAQTTYKGG